MLSLSPASFVLAPSCLHPQTPILSQARGRPRLHVHTCSISELSTTPAFPMQQPASSNQSQPSLTHTSELMQTQPSLTHTSSALPSPSMRRAARLLRLHSKRLTHLLKQQPRVSGEAGTGGGLLLNDMAMLGLALPVLPGAGFQDLLANRVLVTGFVAWFAAQFGKIFTWRFKKGVWNLRAMVQPGGMPSSHSSLCAGVTTALALQEGLSSPLFAVSLAFSVIVMYDAMGVRQHAGKQAAVLNQVVTEILHKNPTLGDIKLKEVLGHTPRQVLCGAVLGLVVALCLPWSNAPQ